MDISTFRTTYGTSPRRQALITLLEAELSDIQKRGWRYRAYVFGSVINKLGKADPNDIDVLLCISAPIADFASPRPKNTNTNIQILSRFITSDFSSPLTLKSCHDLNTMLTYFNSEPANVERGVMISADDCVEVTL